MFTLPSMWNLVISTVVFLVAANYLHRYLETQGLSKGMARGTLVFLIASMISWGSGEMVDWTQGKIDGTKPVEQAPLELSELMKLVGQLHEAQLETKESGSN